MKKFALLVLLVFLLVSCQSSPKTTPSTIATEEAIIDKLTETPTITPSATLVPPTLTATNLTYASYVNTFPLKVTEGTFDFECVADFDALNPKHYKITNNAVVKYWVSCEDGGVEFLIPLFLEDDKMIYPLMANAPSSKMGKTYEFSDASVKKMTENGLEILKVNGKTNIIVVGGNNSSKIIRIEDPFPAIFQATDWDEKMLEFAQTGNPSVLPEILGFSGKLLFGYRIEVVK